MGLVDKSIICFCTDIARCNYYLALQGLQYVLYFY